MFIIYFEKAEFKKHFHTLGLFQLSYGFSFNKDKEKK